MQATVQPCRDARLMLELARACFTSDTWQLAHFETVLMEPSTQVHAIVVDGQAVGYAMSCHDANPRHNLPRGYYLLSLCIHPAYRGKRLGRRLLDAHLHALVTSTKIQKIRLMVRASNTVALTLYINTGWIKEKVCKGYYPATPDAAAEDAVVMYTRPRLRFE